MVTDVQAAVRSTYAANTQMFRLMQGYLALGLLVAITGLGVVMVRSVRERRRTIDEFHEWQLARGFTLTKQAMFPLSLKEPMTAGSGTSERPSV